MTWKRYLESRNDRLLTVFVMFLVAITSYGAFNSTIISSDDWSYFVSKYVFGELHPINLTDRRPFILILYSALSSLFGLHFEIYYFFNFLVLFFSALLVYAIVRRVFPGHTWFPGMVALSYLVYPVDYTRAWLIMLYIRFWWLASLGVIWLLLEFASTGNKWIYMLAMAGIAIPLGAYEGQFGFILLACSLIAFLATRISPSRRLLILGGVIVIGILFLFWRTYIQSRFLDITDPYVHGIQFTPTTLLNRYLQGFRVFFIDWIEPVRAQFKLAGINADRWFFLYIALCSVGFIWLSARRAPIGKMDIHQKLSMAKSYSIAFLIGAAFWIAGYIPIILLYSPSLQGNASRVNMYAITGASLMSVSIVSALAAVLARSISIKRFLTTVMLIPFIVTGIFVQQQVDKERQISWDTQKRIWNAVFRSIPNIKDGNAIVIIIPGYQQLRPFEDYPFQATWEIEAGTQVLYYNPHVGGHFYYKDIEDPLFHFTKYGFRPLPDNNAVPYKKLIFISYDPQTQTAEVVENLEQTIPLPFEVVNYSPYERIAPLQPSTTTYRWLLR